MNPGVTMNEITLYFYPSPGLSWKSPSALALSTAINKLSNLPRGIGHVTVRARSLEGDPIDLLTGMTQIHRHEGRKEVLLKGYGLGILFHDFKGTLEEKEKLEPELVRRADQGNLSFLRIETHRGAIERVRDFIEAYRARGAHEHYGMPHRPRFGEGGGCSAFAASLLEVAGLLDPEYESRWTRRHRLPLSHIGGPLTGNYVGMLKMALRLSWAEEHEPHRELFAWDPDLMHTWLTETWHRESKKPSGQYRVEKWKGARGLVRDARHLPTPSEPLFKGEPSELFRSLERR